MDSSPDLIVSRPSVKKKFSLAWDIPQLLFVLSLILVILSGGAWGGIYYYAKLLGGETASLKDQIRVSEEELDPNLINQILSIFQKLDAGKSLLANHVFTSSVFDFLEKNTHPKVAYSSIGYASESHRIDLSAAAGSYAVLARQISVFESSPMVKQVTFGGLSLAQKGEAGNFVKFNLAITFKPELIKLSVGQAAVPEAEVVPPAPAAGNQ